MKTSKSQRKRGIQWTAWMQLDDIDLADDLALLYDKHQQMLMKIASVSTASESVGINVQHSLYVYIYTGQVFRIFRFM